MKKVLIILAALMLLLTACKKGTPQPTEPVTQPTTQPTTAPPTRPPVEVPIAEEVPVVDDTPFIFEDCAELVGSWDLEVTIPSDYQKIPGFTGSVRFPVSFTFDSEGRYTVSLEPKAYEDAIIGYENLLADFMMDSYYSKFVAEKKISDLTDKQIKQRWEESGRSEAQKKTHSFLDELALGKTFGQLVRSGYYHVEGGELFLSVEDEYESFGYKVDGEGLHLNDCSRLRYYTRLCIYFPATLQPQQKK